MISRYPLVPLGEVLAPAFDEVRVAPTERYDIAGVYSFGRGLFHRSSISGSETAYRHLVRLHRHQLVVSRLKAFEGAVAIVDGHMAGHYVSQEFPTFAIRVDRVDPRYLDWLCRWPAFWSLLAGQSKGLGARRERLHGEELLLIRVPIPLDTGEQACVVTRISSLVQRANRVDQLAHASREQLRQTLPAAAHRADLDRAEKVRRGWREFALGDVLRPTADIHRVEVDRTYPNFGVLSFGRGLFAKPQIDGSRTSAKELFRVRAGQFIYSRLFAFEGAFGRVSDQFDGWFVSNEFPAFVCNDRIATVEFIAAYFQAAQAWAGIAESLRGLGLRRQRLQPEQLLAHRLLVPPRSEQDSIASAFNLAEKAERLYDHQIQRSTSLVPSILNRAFAGDL